MDYLSKLEYYSKNGKLPQKYMQILHNFYLSYSEAIERNGDNIKTYESLLLQYLDLVIEQLKNPFLFESFHKRIKTPFDYHAFGLEIFRPLILFNESKVHRINYVNQIEAFLAKGENVILLANHQIEPDPQVINLLLEKTHSKLAEEMIFVAGHRVITDPLAIPLSMGCNLLCIFSKKYLETIPEHKEEKLLHNQRTMKKMSQLLSEGGKCIYVAPSGGRDRPNEKGKIDVAHFDPQSIEMFWLMAQKAERPTHFFPLALATYHLLPPPHSIEKDVGEHRHASCTPVHLAFNEEIDMENFPGSENLDKKAKRKARCQYIWEIVQKDYKSLESSSPN